MSPHPVLQKPRILLLKALNESPLACRKGVSPPHSNVPSSQCWKTWWPETSSRRLMGNKVEHIPAPSYLLTDTFLLSSPGWEDPREPQGRTPRASSAYKPIFPVLLVSWLLLALTPTHSSCCSASFSPGRSFLAEQLGKLEL